MLNIIDRDHFDKVIEFARKTNQEAQLQEQLGFLTNYSSHEDPTHCRCDLFKDFATYSFYFVMHVKRLVRDRECLSPKCKHRFTAPVIYAKSTPNLSGEKTVRCPKCEWQVTSEPIREEYASWFNGGLIYHGSHDGNGSGEAPTFSVCLTPTQGWSIHT